MTISGAAKLAGVVGWPVAHSLSPRLHACWIEQYGVDAAYLPLAVRPEDFAVAINGLRLAGFRGVNVTIPHKEAAFALADRCDTAAEIAGAANLLLFTDEGIEASNLDAAGLAAALNENLGPGALKGRPAIILGAGGMARAAICALSDLGASEIRILNRNKARAENLAAVLVSRVNTKLSGAGLDEWDQVAGDAHLLVNATSAGMTGAPTLDLKLDALPGDAAVFDAVYNPLETQLLARAKARGLRTIDGLGMLMNQAVPAFKAFFDVEPKVTPALRCVLEEALKHGG